MQESKVYVIGERVQSSCLFQQQSIGFKYILEVETFDHLVPG